MVNLITGCYGFCPPDDVYGRDIHCGRVAGRRRFRSVRYPLSSAAGGYGYSGYQVVQGSGIVYFDTATMVLVLFTLGRYLEAQGRVRAARSLAPMLAAERASVRVVVDGVDAMQPARSVQPGVIVRVLPGERVAVDGIVIAGRSECDESSSRSTGGPAEGARRAGARGEHQRPRKYGRAYGLQETDTRGMQISRLVREALARKSLNGDLSTGVPPSLFLCLAARGGGTLWFWSSRSSLDGALLAGLAVTGGGMPLFTGACRTVGHDLGHGAGGAAGDPHPRRRRVGKARRSAGNRLR